MRKTSQVASQWVERKSRFAVLASIALLAIGASGAEVKPDIEPRADEMLKRMSDPHKDLLQQVTSGVGSGTVTVLGVPCEHLAFSQGEIDWQVWIQNGPRPVPRKFVITYKDEEGSPEYTAIFSNWDFETKLPDFLFTFEPPEGALKIRVEEIKAENQTHQKEGK